LFRCGDGRAVTPDGRGCVDRNECLDLPCLNGGTCHNLDPHLRYRCICPKGFWGEHCQLIRENGQILKLSVSASAAIFTCLLVIIGKENRSSRIFFCVQKS